MSKRKSMRANGRLSVTRRLKKKSKKAADDGLDDVCINCRESEAESGLGCMACGEAHDGLPDACKAFFKELRKEAIQREVVNAAAAAAKAGMTEEQAAALGQVIPIDSTRVH